MYSRNSIIVLSGLIFRRERAGVKLLIVLLRRARQMESPGLNDFDVAAVNEELAHILASEHFTNAERMRSFLSYIVSETLAGRAERIKSYSIAIEVFHRGWILTHRWIRSFEPPQTDCAAHWNATTRIQILRAASEYRSREVDMYRFSRPQKSRPQTSL
ncbi:hypothetical protein DEA98_24915 [Brucella pseudogrignonensis]|nr:hypothetical protein [Brucella pseudogrignonensis]